MSKSEGDKSSNFCWNSFEWLHIFSFNFVHWHDTKLKLILICWPLRVLYF